MDFALEILIRGDFPVYTFVKSHRFPDPVQYYSFFRVGAGFKVVEVFHCILRRFNRRPEESEILPVSPPAASTLNRRRTGASAYSPAPGTAFPESGTTAVRAQPCAALLVLAGRPEPGSAAALHTDNTMSEPLSVLLIGVSPDNPPEVLCGCKRGSSPSQFRIKKSGCSVSLHQS